jgi:hypothetical protein
MYFRDNFFKACWILLICAGINSGVVKAWAVPSTPDHHRRAAQFFLKYFQLNGLAEGKDEAQWLAAAPAWFKALCQEQKLPLNCDRSLYSKNKFDHVIDVFRNGRYQSIMGGAIEQGLTAAMQNPNQAFQVLAEVYEKFGDQFEFNAIQKNRDEEAKWYRLLKGMPVLEELALTIDGKALKLVFRGEDKKYALTIHTSDGTLIFKDGPRLLEAHSEGERLSTSMTESYTHPEFRNFGLYQLAIKHYLERLHIERVYLYTENPQTLEFIYRVMEFLMDAPSRRSLLQIPGIPQYLEAFSIPLDQFVDGDHATLMHAQNVLGYLSLQGRTRVNAGLSFFIDDVAPTIIHSVLLDPESVANIKSRTKALERTLKDTLKTASESDPIYQLPSTYLKKLKDDLAKEQPITCNAILSGS